MDSNGNPTSWRHQQNIIDIDSDAPPSPPLAASMPQIQPVIVMNHNGLADYDTLSSGKRDFLKCLECASPGFGIAAQSLLELFSIAPDQSSSSADPVDSLAIASTSDALDIDLDHIRSSTAPDESADNSTLPRQMDALDLDGEPESEFFDVPSDDRYFRSASVQKVSSKPATNSAAPTDSHPTDGVTADETATTISADILPSTVEPGEVGASDSVLVAEPVLVAPPLSIPSLEIPLIETEDTVASGSGLSSVPPPISLKTTPVAAKSEFDLLLERLLSSSTTMAELDGITLFGAQDVSEDLLKQRAGPVDPPESEGECHFCREFTM